MKVFAQLIFLFPVYQTCVNETAAVCHHQGRHSAEKRAAKQWARLYTCHLQQAVPWASCVCAYTVPMPYPVCNTEPRCTAYHLQPCFVIWMQKASATTDLWGGSCMWDLLVHQANIGLRASSGAAATSSSIIPAVNLSGEAPLRDRTAELQGAVLPTGSWGLLLAPHQQTGASENHLSQEHRVLAHTPNLLPSHYLLGVIVPFPNS